jgi:hypothetical protein
MCRQARVSRMQALQVSLHISRGAPMGFTEGAAITRSHYDGRYAFRYPSRGIRITDVFVLMFHHGR